MSGPSVSINGATVNNQTPVTGDSVDLGDVMSKHNALFAVTDMNSTGSSGMAATLAIELDGSLDGQTWYPLAKENITANGVFVLSPDNDNTFICLYLRAVANVASGQISATVNAEVVSAA